MYIFVISGETPGLLILDSEVN